MFVVECARLGWRGGRLVFAAAHGPGIAHYGLFSTAHGAIPSSARSCSSFWKWSALDALPLWLLLDPTTQVYPVFLTHILIKRSNSSVSMTRCQSASQSVDMLRCSHLRETVSLSNTYTHTHNTHTRTRWFFSSAAYMQQFLCYL